MVVVKNFFVVARNFGVIFGTNFGVGWVVAKALVNALIEIRKPSRVFAFVRGKVVGRFVIR